MLASVTFYLNYVKTALSAFNLKEPRLHVFVLASRDECANERVLRKLPRIGQKETSEKRESVLYRRQPPFLSISRTRGAVGEVEARARGRAISGETPEAPLQDVRQGIL